MFTFTLIAELGVFGAFFIVGAILAEAESHGWTGFLQLLLLGAGAHLLGIDLWPLTPEVRLRLITGAGCYVGVGVVWSLFRWTTFLFAFRRAFRRVKEAYMAARNPATEDPSDFRNYATHARVDEAFREPIRKLKKPTATHYKSLIIGWIAYWPLSMAGYVGRYLLKDIFRFIFTRLRRIYDAFVGWIFREDKELT